MMGNNECNMDYKITYSEAIERLKYMKIKAEVALSTTKCTCSWAKESVKGTIMALDMAINALENQIPKKPRFYAHNYYCSVCYSLVGNNEFEWKRFEYCDTCGQKIDWSNVE